MNSCIQRMQRVLKKSDKVHIVMDVGLKGVYKYLRRNWIETSVFNETMRIEEKAKKWYRSLPNFQQLKELAHVENPTAAQVLRSIRNRLETEGILNQRTYGE